MQDKMIQEKLRQSRAAFGVVGTTEADLEGYRAQLDSVRLRDSPPVDFANSCAPGSPESGGEAKGSGDGSTEGTGMVLCV